MKIHKLITLSLLVSVFLILSVNVNYFNEQQDFVKDNQETQLQNENLFQKEIINYEELNFDSPKSSTLLDSKEAYAIVVGISDYPGTSSDLSYCDDDSQDIYSMLINDFNFKTENVYYLQDSVASKAAISDAFDQIASKIDADDIFFFYYSGHGGAGTSSTGSQSYSIDSPHPYSNYYDRLWSIYRSGAVYMRVHFDHFDVEYDYDYVYLGDTDLSSGWYYEAYTGYSTGFWSGWIPLLSDNKLYVRMVTDYSITEWGFSIDSFEAMTYDGTHYLCSYDSVPSTPSNYYMDDLLDSKLDQLNCSEKYVVLDACNTGGMIPEIQEIGTYIMTACRDDEFSLESSSLQHGVFTNFFLKSFDLATDSNADGVISMEESYSYTSSNTISYSGGLGYTHHPQQYDGISGNSVLFTAFGALSLTPVGNSLFYSFHMYGTGLIEDLRIAVCNVSETITYVVEDLTEIPASNTGFGYYAGTIPLNGVTGITDYGIFARISGDDVIYLNQTVSNDTDSDLIDDITEIMFGMNVFNADSDSDGLDDYTEFYGITDPLSNDTDNDGMSDYFEVICNLNPLFNDANLDYDNDGLSNLLEFLINSLANNTDSDDDLMPDFWEYNNGLNLAFNDASLDPDNDELNNFNEFQAQTDPNNPDTDADELFDGLEISTYFTDPLNPDTDGDGYTDGIEVQWGTDPLDPKISLNTIFFNIAGIGILASLSYPIVRTTLTNKKQKTKPIKNKIKIGKKPKVYNAVKVEKKFKPKPKPKPSPYSRSLYPQSYSRPTYTQTRPRYGSNNVEFKKIIDLILYGLPAPKSIYSAEGKKAQTIANTAFKSIDQGRFTDGFNNMINALVLGVPEPTNTRIKMILLKSLSQFSSSSQSTNTIQKFSNIKKCSWCGKENKMLNKFCLNCGRRL